VSESWCASCGVRALNAHTRGQERGQRACGFPQRGGLALEQGGPRSRGGVEPSSEVDPAQGDIKALIEADLTRGVSRCAALAGRGGHQGRGRVVYVF
jgi:hypothetical protein